MTVDTSDPRVRGRFQRFMAERQEQRNRVLKKLQLDAIELQAQEEYAASLQKFFMARARRIGA